MRESEAAALLDARRAELLARLASVDAELLSIQGMRSDSTSDDEHDPEGSTLSGDWSRIVAHRNDATAQLRDLERAVERLAAGEYGICVVCGRAIPDARLRVKPAAERCVGCASS
jgi:RNA polymerase-binding transcription factor DksA